MVLSSWSRNQQESIQWEHKGSSTPKKFCVQQLAGKIMATVFWGSDGVLLSELMPHKTSITGDIYASTMVALCENIKQKCCGNLLAGVLLLQDNCTRTQVMHIAGFYKEMCLCRAYPSTLQSRPGSKWLLSLQKPCLGNDFPMTTLNEWTLLILQPFHHFTHIITHSPTLLSLYLHHSSFSNPSIASPMSQFILQPFFSFSCITSSSLNSPGELPMI